MQYLKDGEVFVTTVCAAFMIFFIYTVLTLF